MNRGFLALLSGVAFVVVLGLLLPVGASPASATDHNQTVTLYGTERSFDDGDAVTTAIANDTLKPTDKLVVGETLIAAIDSHRLADSLDEPNESATDQFFEVTNQSADFRIEQTNPGTMRPRKVMLLGPENVTVFRAGTTTYVLIDTGGVEYTFRGESNPPAEVRDGDRFAVTFGYHLDEHDTSGPVFEVYAAKAEFSAFDQYQRLAPELVNRSVRVNIEPTSQLIARLTLSNNRTIIAPVQPVKWSGIQGVTFDLRRVDPGTKYVLELIHDGTVVERHTGSVVERKARISNVTLTAVTTELTVTRDGERVPEEITDHTAVVLTANLSHGGRINVLNAACERVGFTRVAPANETRVTIKLWDNGHPMRNVNRSDYAYVVHALWEGQTRDFLYPGSDAEITENFEGNGCDAPPVRNHSENPGPLTPASPTPSTPGPPTTERPPQTTTVTNTLTTDERTGPTTTPGQPGFTVLAMVIAALLVALRTVNRA